MDFFVVKDYNVVQCQCLLMSLGYCLSFIGPHFKLSADG